MATESDDALRQLDDAELAALRPLGVRRTVSAGEYLYREGDPGYDFYVVLSGAVGIVVLVVGLLVEVGVQPAGGIADERRGLEDRAVGRLDPALAGAVEGGAEGIGGVDQVVGLVVVHEPAGALGGTAKLAAVAARA